MGVEQLGNEKVIDSSYERSRPFIFQVGVGQVVEGWDIAVRQLSKGGKGTCTVPAAFAYGKKGIPGLIPPNTDLHLEIEMLNIVAVEYAL